MEVDRLEKLTVTTVAIMGLLFTCSMFPMAEEGIFGLWQGVLEFPGIESRLVLDIYRAPGGLSVDLIKPDEGVAGIRASRTRYDGLNLSLEFSSIDAGFDGKYLEVERRIEGKWSFGKRQKTITFVEVSKITYPERPQTPQQPHPYEEESVTFKNAVDGVTLSGSLTYPESGGPFPGVIFISGGGGQDRDYTIFGHKPFLVMADYLTRRGFAVLRFDDRGIGGSTGNRRDATSEDFSRDVLAGVEYLSTVTEVDPERIGLIGHSEGGTVAALAASKSEAVTFIVMMGSPGLPGLEYNLQFEEYTARALNQSKEAISARLEFQRQVLTILAGETDEKLAEEKLREIYRRLPGIAEPEIDLAIDRLLSPWFRYNLIHDPGETLAQVTCPVLALFGELDVQVPPERNLEEIRSALESGSSHEYRIELIPGVNHFFQTAETGSPLECRELGETISPDVLELIANWIMDLV